MSFNSPFEKIYKQKVFSSNKKNIKKANVFPNSQLKVDLNEDNNLYDKGKSKYKSNSLISDSNYNSKNNDYQELISFDLGNINNNSNINGSILSIRSEKYLNSKNKFFNHVVSKNKNISSFISFDQNDSKVHERGSIIDKQIEKHMSGQKEQHEDYKKYNLNLHQDQNENQKYFQDNLQRTKQKFDDESILKQRQIPDKFDAVEYTIDKLYKNDKSQSENSKVDLYLNQKLLDKINDDQNHNNTKVDNHTLQLNNCMKSKLAPRDSGILRKSNSMDKLYGYQGSKLLNSMVDSYTRMSTEDQPQEIDLSNNHLKNKDVIPFIKTIRRKLRHLNLRNNNLGPTGCNALTEVLYDNPLANINQLNLEGTGIVDRSGSNLIEALVVCKNLKHLNLNTNELSTKCGIQIDNLLYHVNIEHLELHQNKFNGSDLMPFVSNLNNQPNLQIIDLSWNSIGNDELCVRTLSENLSSNKILNKLDLSHNNITSNLVPIFQECLASNHTLIGLHLTGNQMRLDPDGFVIYPQHSLESQALTKVQSENSELSSFFSKKNKHLLTNDWIKEWWVPVEVECIGEVMDENAIEQRKKDKLIKEHNLANGLTETTKKPIFKIKVASDALDLIKGGKLKLNFKKIEIDNPVFVHFEFDGQEPWLIKRDDDKLFKAQFMIPPGKWRLFFTTQLVYFVLSDQLKIEYLDDPVTYKIIFDKKNPASTTIEMKIIGQNILQVPENLYKIDQRKCPVLPRTRPRWTWSETSIKWSFPISIWAKQKWVKDETENQIKAFDHDWEIIKDKLPKAVKDDEKEKAKIKGIIRPQYNLFTWMYRQQSSYFQVADIFCINEALFLTLFGEIDQFGQQFTKEIPPIIFRETVTSDKNNYKELSPSNGCVRHQFMNQMIKAAARKYKIEPKVNIPYSEAVQLMFDNQTEKFTSFAGNVWRWDRYQNEKCDNFLKKAGFILDEVMSRQMAMQGDKPGEKLFFNLKAFNILIKDLAMEDYIDDIHICNQQNMSLTIHVSHLTSDAFTKIRNKFEFQETFARMSDECQYDMHMDGIEYPKGNYKDLDLGDKLWVMITLFTKIFNPSVKADQKWIASLKTCVNDSGVLKFI